MLISNSFLIEGGEAVDGDARWGSVRQRGREGGLQKEALMENGECRGKGEKKIKLESVERKRDEKVVVFRK